MNEPPESIVGRGPELRAVGALLDRLAAGEPSLVELAGEPGIGKSRLLAELTSRACARGHLVLSGSASELEQELPFWLFVDALDDYLAASEPGRLRALEADTLAELGHVFPALLAAGGEPVDAPHERFRTHRAVRQLLEALARPKPLVLLLDDLHWADSGSIELLGALLRRPPGGAVMVVMTVRPRQTPDRLSAALARAHRMGALVRLDLGPLSEAESRLLLGEGVSRSVGAALHEESGGNPFYLEQLARSLRRRMADLPSEHALQGLDVPSMVAATLADELALLSGGARRLLEGAAVAGDPFDLDLGAAAAAVGDAAAMDGLDELLGHDFVRPTEVPRRFRFRHPLVRQAVYESAPGGWRLGAHQRSADALAARGATAASRAHHVEQVGRYGDEGAIAVLREAGEAAAQRTPAGAARWFAAALRLLPEGAPAERRIELLTALSRALAATGQFEEARTALEEEIRIVPASAVAQRVELASASAAVEQLLGRHEQARSRLETALAGLEDQASREAAGLCIDLGVADFYRVEYESSGAYAERALAIARRLGDRPLHAAALGVLALAKAFSAPREEADRRCAEAAALIDEMADEEIEARLDALAHLAAGESYVERFEAGAAHAERALALARMTAQGQLLPLLIPSLATVFLALGRLAEAIDLLDGGVESARLTGNTQGLVINLYNRALMGMLAGDLDTALALAEESVELVRDLDVNVISAWAGAVLGFVLMERDEHARGIETVYRLCGGAELSLLGGSWRAFCFDRVTRGLLAQGRRAEAERSAAQAAEIATASGQRHPEAMARRAAASIALDAGDAAGAAAHALASAAAADEIGARLEAALSRVIAGRALGAAGEPERAAAELERATTELEACGALRYRDDAERELRKLGHRRRRRPRSAPADGTGVDSLSQRELEVARLIVDRRTNPQIAAEFFLSTKTVETHIRNLFFKLGVSSRVDVARIVERAERTP